LRDGVRKRHRLTGTLQLDGLSRSLPAMTIAFARLVVLGLVTSSLACSSSTVPEGTDAGTAPATDGGGTCPTVRPTQGTACAPDGLSCQLGKNPTGCDSDSASCRQGKWVVYSTPGCATPKDSGTD
jgi:hypothetical protein